jgi:hypothetical protein
MFYVCLGMLCLLIIYSFYADEVGLRYCKGCLRGSFILLFLGSYCPMYGEIQITLCPKVKLIINNYRENFVMIII